MMYKGLFPCQTKRPLPSPPSTSDIFLLSLSCDSRFFTLFKFHLTLPVELTPPLPPSLQDGTSFFSSLPFFLPSPWHVPFPYLVLVECISPLFPPDEAIPAWSAIRQAPSTLTATLGNSLFLSPSEVRLMVLPPPLFSRPHAFSVP